ncbi:glycerophosphodiester phosphodiesterase family protein [Yoonia sp. BS5-3]|uniref:Glycerophosphodiester phosphodiesterase family protein n=1 Tax=Yoonia phaeophyticola TaxID=3137369 RepID=A0ABZ2V088_9RHOB
MKRLFKRLVIGALLLIAALWAGNTSRLVSGLDQHQTRLIAHRGVHQIYVGTDRSIDACHAAPVAPMTHRFVENTLSSMQEAFRLGADVVELDIHLTPDNVFAVFHDWTLDCRTNGSGVTNSHLFADLQTLDLGYRIDDGTQTYPLRGTGIEQMPSLSQVFAAEMEGQFLINFKSRRTEEGIALTNMLADTRVNTQVFGVYGGQPPTRAATGALPGLRGFDRASIKTCLTRYLALGWSGHVPQDCQNTILLIPQNYAPLLWGWPHRFTQRMKAAGTTVILAGPYDGSGFSSGIDDADTFAKVPADFDGYLWTNRIEVIGPLLANQDN